MDRRDFFKTIFATPLITPFLLGSQSSTNNELFLINDRPATYLPSSFFSLSIRCLPDIIAQTNLL